MYTRKVAGRVVALVCGEQRTCWGVSVRECAAEASPALQVERNCLCVAVGDLTCCRDCSPPYVSAWQEFVDNCITQILDRSVLTR